MAVDEYLKKLYTRFTVFVPKRHSRVEVDVLKIVPDEYQNDFHEKFSSYIKGAWGVEGAREIDQNWAINNSYWLLNSLAADNLIEQDKTWFSYRRTDLGRGLLKELEGKDIGDGAIVDITQYSK